MGLSTFSITIKNKGGDSSEGYIWVSFPDCGEIDKVEGTGSSVKNYPKGSLIKKDVVKNLGYMPISLIFLFYTFCFYSMPIFRFLPFFPF
ncbi:hypothetical protein AOB57_013695 [Methanosarcina flavescens]|uniref:Uncharacterized protein n=1 Tax=Methanosarcina flavescens TaxID=1715806 RepID=A0A660HUS9_9EURY|nr:hypothetical protein AOB57_013695 [Methanosarcina flavescens]